MENDKENRDKYVKDFQQYVCLSVCLILFNIQGCGTVLGELYTRSGFFGRLISFILDSIDVKMHTKYLEENILRLGNYDLFKKN